MCRDEGRILVLAATLAGSSMPWDEVTVPSPNRPADLERQLMPAPGNTATLHMPVVVTVDGAELDPWLWTHRGPKVPEICEDAASQAHG